MKCLLCNAPLNYRLTIKDICWPGKIQRPSICPCCATRFRPIQGPCCPACSRPQSDAKLCLECQKWQHKYGWHLYHRALFCYDAAMKDYMQRYKFMGDYRLRAVFHDDLCQAVQQVGTGLVVPIPVTQTTMHTRGFNQVKGLLEGRTIAEVLVHQHKDKLAQSHKTRRDRLKTPQPFLLKDAAQILNKRVILVDDIYTTGRTLYHAAILLKKAGASEVLSISLAR